jgi:isopenicillin-N N-acyltransferase like protein
VTKPGVVDLPAPPRARGEAHGEALRPLIAEGVARWKDSLAAISGGDPDDWIRAFLSGTGFVPSIERHTPGLLEEVRGLAAGAGVDDDLMLAFQLVDEQWCWTTRALAARRAEHEHCSTLGIVPDEGSVLVAQNLDLPLWWEGLQTVLRFPAHQDEPGSIVVTAAGFIVMNGMNDAGVGIGVNALPDVPSATTGLPVAFVIRGALARRTASAAAGFINDVSHASGQNYIVGDADGVTGIEADAEGTTAYDAAGGCALHTNHAVARSSLSDPVMVAGGALANSFARLEYLASRRGSIGNSTDVVEVLSDGSVPIRRVPTDASPSSTFATVVFELGPAPVARVRGGLDETEFVTVEPLGVRQAAR